MADYVNNAEHNVNGVNTLKDYELYCHYVAGLVGEGCTRLFVEGGLANPALLQRPELMESMGQFLQQVNIIRDIKEDLDDKRRFWPKEIWSKYVTEFEDFCAIPQSMAIATLDACFQNHNIFKQNVKITKGQACQLMIESSQNLQLVCDIFKRYCRKISKKNNPHDPNFMRISIACGKVC